MLTSSVKLVAQPATSLYVTGINGLQVVNIANPSAPVLAGSYKTYADDVYVVGNYAYPRNGERAGMPTSFYYAELQQVAPGNNQDSPLELPSAQAQARSDLHIVWQEDSSSTPPGFAYRANLVSLSGQEISYPRPSILIASLSKVDLVAKANLTVKLKAPDGNTTSLTLTDDGITPDVLANDGLYTGFMPYNQAGNYEIIATFDNTAGTAEFTKSSCNFALGPAGETP